MGGEIYSQVRQAELNHVFWSTVSELKDNMKRWDSKGNGASIQGKDGRLRCTKRRHSLQGSTASLNPGRPLTQVHGRKML